MGGTGLEQEVSIEEIAPIYMILHAKAFQMQSALIHLPFHACLLEEIAPLYMILHAKMDRAGARGTCV